jgi:hypothetical protein
MFAEAMHDVSHAVAANNLGRCFCRHLGDQLAETARTVQAAMMSEFHTSALDVVANMATDTVCMGRGLGQARRDSLIVFC